MTKDNGRRNPEWELHHDAHGRLVLTDALGRAHPGAEVVRAFPLSEPRRGVSIVDAGGKELAWIEDLDELLERGGLYARLHQAQVEAFTG